MPGRYGERGLAPQDEGSAGAALKRLQPFGFRFESGDDGRGGGEDARAGAGRPLGAAEQRPRGGADRIALQQLGQRRPLAAAGDLKEAEAVHRRALERLRQDGVDGGGGGAPLRLRSERREVDADRAADAEAADRPRRGGRAGEGELV